jgi:aspartate/methionine/tyrosine aminotransferase
VFSSRTVWNLAPNPLSRALDARRRAGRPVLDLTDSNPTRCGFAYPGEAIRRALDTPEALGYAPHPRGLPAAREAVAARARREGFPVEADRVLLTSSTSEAYAFLFRLLADPGDAVLVPRPSYPLFDFLARMSDVRTVPYPLREGPSGWRIDPDALRAAAGPRTRAAVVVNPNNPTGSFVSGAERDLLHGLGRERGLALIADEVFVEYPFDDGVPAVRFTAPGESLTFALGGLSKYAGLPQLKIAWIVVGGPEPAAEEALARLDVIADTFLSVATPVQAALPALLDLAAGIRAEIRSRVRANRRCVLEATAGRTDIRCLPADGGWYAVLADAAGRDDEAWAVELLERDGVLVHPGHFYEFEEEGRLVLSLLVSPDVLGEGLGRILAHPA